MVSGVIIDFLAIGFYFVIVLGVGWRASTYADRGGRDFSLGGRAMPWWAITASILASELSAATFLGAPGEGYSLRNFTYAQLAIGTVLARVIVAYLFLRPFYDYNVVSIYELMERRFGTITKNAASGVFLITRLLASGCRLYAPAIILVLAGEIWMGQPLNAFQEVNLYAVCIIGITIMTAIYTTLGGIRAVVWTDLLQASVMIGAVLYTIISLLMRVGGWAGVSSALNGPHDWQFFDTGTQPNLPLWDNIKNVLGSEYTIYAALLGSTFLTMATHGTDQDMVQRMLTAPNYHRSRLALIASGLADFPMTMAFLFIGMLLAAFYQLHPDKDLTSDHVFAYFILHEMPAGARGLVVAGLLATAMGSLSTALNALATSFSEDFYKPYFGGGKEVSVSLLRWCTVGFAVLLAAIGIITAYIVIESPKARILPVVLGIFGYTYGSLLGIFLVALTTKTRGSEIGNVAAMICGFICVAILSGLPWDIMNAIRGNSTHIDSNIIYLVQHGLAGFKAGWITPPPSFLQIEFPWRILFGSVTTYLVAICFRTKPKEISLAAGTGSVSMT